MRIRRRPGVPFRREAGASALARPEWQPVGDTAPAEAPAPGTLRLHLCPAGQLPGSWNRPEVLSQAELDQLGQLAPGNHRQAWLAAHLMLRHVLAAQLGLDPADLPLRRAACRHCGKQHGRPVLAGPAGRRLHFSLSHAAGLALVAVAASPCGVDVEAVPAAPTVQAVRHQLHRAERADLAQATGVEQAVEFARIWTRKEAWLKATGAGLRGGLDGFYAGVRATARLPAGAWFGDGTLEGLDLGAAAGAGAQDGAVQGAEQLQRGEEVHWAAALRGPAARLQAHHHGVRAG